MVNNEYSGYTVEEYEKQIMLHRYCYYVLCDPLIPDVEYDKLERAARAVCPENSIVHKIGSDRASDYSEYIKQIVKEKGKGVGDF